MNSFPPWDELFPSVNEPAWTVTFRVLRKHGKPLLLLPPDPGAATHGLQLFPAQTLIARGARILARWMLRADLRLRAEFVRVPFAAGDPLISFLSGGPRRTGQPPQFVVLAGNAATAGRRFIVLTFDAAQRPQQVVKIGVSPTAQDLIRAEERILEQLSAQHVAGVPALRSPLETGRLRGFSMDYVEGRTPQGAANCCLLRSWVKPGLMVLAHAPAWQRLSVAAGTDPAFQALRQRIGIRQVHSAFWHGDFAPWNIKVDRQGEWTALDWERAECEGIPGWDWFHYVLQREILVRKADSKVVAKVANELLESADFQDYARAAAVTGLERELLLAYTLYMQYVVQPSEGSRVLHELRSRLLQVA